MQSFSQIVLYSTLLSPVSEVSGCQSDNYLLFDCELYQRNLSRYYTLVKDSE